MQNLTVLIGAGASRNITGFVTAGLFGQVKELINKRPSAATLAALLQYSAEPTKIGSRFEAFLSQLAIFTRLQASQSWPLDLLQLDVPLPGTAKAEERRKRLSTLLTDMELAIAVACNASLPASSLITESASEPTAFPRRRRK